MNYNPNTDACPARDVEPGAAHVFEDGHCVFCKMRYAENAADALVRAEERAVDRRAT